MKTVSQIAYDNLKYHKSKNILTGIAIFLTTFLLFIVPTIGKDIIDAQYEMVNEIYPEWYGSYADIDIDTVHSVSAHYDIGTWGLQSDVGVIPVKNVSGEVKFSMIYMDKNGVDLSKQTLAEGRFPEQENEIVISKILLEMLGMERQIGDTITIPYQLIKDGGYDYKEEGNFVISGFLEQENAATVFISEPFLQEKLSEEDISYQFLFQLGNVEHATTDNVEDTINEIAKQFEISEKNIVINTSYLEANYVDPAFLQIVIVILIIVIFAGIITIYSIYYVSMAQRVQEFGRLKAVGATKRQIRQVVLREGMFVALCAIPLALLFGTLMTRVILLLFVNILEGNGNLSVAITKEIIAEHKIVFFHWWIYLLAIVVTLLTVYLSLLKPMKMAGRVSVIEAMRFQGNTGRNMKSRKGYDEIRIGRLAKNNIFSNRKKSLITILSMSITGVFIMVVATVLSCTSPELITNTDFNGQYAIIPIVQSGDKEHPEWEWTEVQKNNPLNEELEQKILALDGVARVDMFSMVDVGGGLFEEEDYGEDITGLPKEYAKELEDGIIKGSATWEDLMSGDKVVIDDTLVHWYPELSVGSKIQVTIHDNDRDYEKELEIIAIGDYRGGLTNYNCMIMAKEAADSLVSYNVNRYAFVFADKEYDEALENALFEIVGEDEMETGLEMRAKQTDYKLNKTMFQLVNSVCYIFLGILSVICIMNLINTMINSVNVRRKEFGMMQAIGMSDGQLQKMLFAEGLFYTLGTLIVSVGAGSLLGYGAFLWAKSEGILSIRTYQYPVTIAIIVVVTLVVVQAFLVLMLGKSVKKESLIERIRFHE